MEFQIIYEEGLVSTDPSAVPSGHLVLNITNLANSYTASCVIDSVNLAGYISNLTSSNDWYDCDLGDNASSLDPLSADPFSERPEYTVSTAIQFDKPTGKFGVNQTWYCVDGNETAYVDVVLLRLLLPKSYHN